MANIIRSAKSGSDWTANDLDSYHIEVRMQTIAEFFGNAALPDPQVDEELLTITNAQDMQRDRNAELVNLLDLAMTRSTGESAVVDFAVELFKVLGYVRRDRVARTRKDTSLHICGEFRHAKTDVCIFDRSQDDIILLVQEDKRMEEAKGVDPTAQLIAEALAAFAENNRNRIESGLPPLQEKDTAGITLAGTFPTFFKIPITQGLVDHVRFGTYPPNAVNVSFCVPALSQARRGHETT